MRAVLLALACVVVALPSLAQPVQSPAAVQQTEPSDELPAAPSKVDVNPVAHDQAIQERLQRVLVATGWFSNPRVRVEEGVAFLNGETESGKLRNWAADLARNTQDVVAVVNRIEVRETSVWDLRPAGHGLKILWRDVIRALPFFLFGLIVTLLALGAGMLTTRIVRRLLRRRIAGALLRNVVARAAGLFVVLVGVYIVLRIAGLTRLALTVVGSTGLIGLAVGIAFRDITENFLASIFLSMQKPFETGDLVEITGVTGYVQQLNVRTTILMTLEGNLVQIPNAAVYKNNLRNFTTNANRREDFVVGIGYDDSINEAQELARTVLAGHPAVLADPEPSVLADSLGQATVNLRVYFWLNGREHSWLKVRSSVIRLVKRAFQQNGISMPDEAREVLFPQGLPVTIVKDNDADAPDRAERSRMGAAQAEDGESVSTRAEAGLYSEAEVIEKQARTMRPLPDDENLLRGDDGR
ncbi:MAG: mechanosensitive ion channel family protein [Acidobacteriota bacterium]